MLTISETTQRIFVSRGAEPNSARAPFPPKPLPALPVFLDNRPAVRHNETEQKRPGRGRFSLWLLLYPAPALPRKDRGKRPKKERILNQEDDDGLRRWNFGQRSRCDEHNPHLCYAGDFDPWCAVAGFGRHFAASGGAGTLPRRKGGGAWRLRSALWASLPWLLAGTRLFC